jgi:hypothetical protein
LEKAQPNPKNTSRAGFSPDTQEHFFAGVVSHRAPLPFYTTYS